MSRPLRIEYPCAWYHVMNRGARHQAIFLYAWSSYSAYLRRTKKPDWLTLNTVLSYFGRRSARYHAYVEADMDTETQQFYARQRLSPIMGDQAFKDQLLEITDTDRTETPELRRLTSGIPIAEIEQLVCKVYAVQARQLHESIRGQKNQPRLVAMYLARKLGGMTYPEIAAHFELGHYKSATSAITRVQRDEKLLRAAEHLRRKWRETS